MKGYVEMYSHYVKNRAEKLIKEIEEFRELQINKDILYYMRHPHKNLLEKIFDSNMEWSYDEACNFLKSEKSSEPFWYSTRMGYLKSTYRDQERDALKLINAFVDEDTKMLVPIETAGLLEQGLKLYGSTVI